MRKPVNLTSILTGLLLSVTSAACGRAAVAHPRQNGELRISVRDEPLRASNHDADSSRFEDPTGPRALRVTANDSLQEARAIRNGWAAWDGH
jgi:hypothetical protein